MNKTLKEIQKEQRELLKGLEHPRIGNVLGLFEEVGELAKEIMEEEICGRNKSLEIADECADVLFSHISLCDSYGIDLGRINEKTLREIQEEQRELQKGLNNPRIVNVLGLFERVGELAKEVMEAEIYGRKSVIKLGDKCVDVFFRLISLCDSYGIDSEVAYEQKTKKICDKIPGWVGDYGEILDLMRKKLD